MGLYNFQARFVEAILRGEKTHTIRATRAYMDEPGDTMHLYTGLRRRGPIIQKLESGEVVRQKMSRLLGRFECLAVDDITIDFALGRHPFIMLGKAPLLADERDAFARRDGFQDFADMLTFWKGRLPFRGHVFHWKYDPRRLG